MSDSISGGVADQVKGLERGPTVSASESVKPKEIFKTVIDQIRGVKPQNPEEEAKKKQEAIQTQRIIQEIEEEMKKYAAEREKLTGPEIPTKNDGNEADGNNTNEDLMHTQTNQNKTQNLQVTLAQTKNETGRGAKG